MKSRIVVSLLIPTLIIFLSSCSKPYDKIINKTWEGQIYRMDDDKRLSDVRLKMSNDTLYLYANAIFGAENDTMILQKFEKKDSTFTYKSLNGNVFSFRFSYNQTEGTKTLYFIGDDHYFVLGPSSLELTEAGALDFYLNIVVPLDAYMYLDGAYEGEMEMENKFTNLFFGSIGGISVKLVFLDDFKVKIYAKSLLGDMFSDPGKPSYEIVDYTASGNKLILNRNKSTVQNIEVRNYGETLVMATDDANVVLHKIY